MTQCRVIQYLLLLRLLLLLLLLLVLLLLSLLLDNRTEVLDDFLH